MDFGFEVLKHVSYICSLNFESLTQAPVKRKLLHKLGRKKRSFDVDGENAVVTEGEPTLLGSISGGRVQDINFSPADFATVETEMGGGGGKRRMNLYQKHRSKSRYLYLRVKWEGCVTLRHFSTILFPQFYRDTCVF